MTASQLDKLNFSVRMGTIAYRATADQIRTTDRGRVAIRTDTNDALAVVGNAYTPVQPSTSVAVVQELIKRGHLRDSDLRVSLYDDGARFSIRAFTGRSVQIGGTAVAEEVRLYDGFDARTSYQVNVGMQVLVCSNGLTVWKGKNSRLKHTLNIEDRLQLTLKELYAQTQQFDQRVEQLNRLTQVRITNAGVQRVIEEFFPAKEDGTVPTRTANTREQFARIYEQAPGAAPGSLWGLSQAVTYYTTHMRGRDGSREEQALFGAGSTFSQDAHDILFRNADLTFATLS